MKCPKCKKEMRQTRHHEYADIDNQHSDDWECENCDSIFYQSYKLVKDGKLEEVEL